MDDHYSNQLSVTTFNQFPFSQQQPYEYILHFPSEIAEGNVTRYLLSNGLELVIRDLKMHQSYRWQTFQETPLFELCFTLAGEMQFEANHQSYLSCNNQIGTGFIRESSVSLDQFAGDLIRTITIYLSESALQKYFFPFVPNSRQSIDSFFKRGHAQFIQRPMDINLQVILQQILHCPYSGNMKKFYLESKVLELLVVYFSQYENEKTAKQNHTWSKQDIEQIHRAKEWILHHLEAPLTIGSISKAMGINDFKLKKGFRELFGTTVFNFIREQRLAKAKHLLSIGRMNVTEVSLAVGYQNPSRFAAAFKRKFGLTPSQYRTAK